MLEKLFTFSALRDGKGGGRVRLKMLHLTTPNKFLARLWSNGIAPDTPAATLPGSPIIRTSCGCELFSTPPTLRLSDIPATLQVTLTCPNVRLSGQLGCCFCRLPLLLAGFLCFFCRFPFFSGQLLRLPLSWPACPKTFILCVCIICRSCSVFCSGRICRPAPPGPCVFCCILSQKYYLSSFMAHVGQ